MKIILITCKNVIAIFKEPRRKLCMARELFQ